MTITKSKTRKVNNTESKLWLKVFRVVNGGGYAYADAKIKQLSIYFIFVCSILGYLFSPFGIVLGIRIFKSKGKIDQSECKANK